MAGEESLDGREPAGPVSLREHALAQLMNRDRDGPSGLAEYR